MFIVFEGIDGSGKTTVSKIVAEILAAGWTKEPTNRFFHIYENMKYKSPYYEAVAYIEDRDEHIPEILDMQLTYGHVVCDRYYLSTLAYSGAKGLDTKELIKMAVPSLIPNYTFVLDVPIDLAVERLKERGEEPDPKQLLVLRENYLMLAQSLHNVYVIDGSQDIWEILDDIYHIIKDDLGIFEKLRWKKWIHKYFKMRKK